MKKTITKAPLTLKSLRNDIQVTCSQNCGAMIERITRLEEIHQQSIEDIAKNNIRLNEGDQMFQQLNDKIDSLHEKLVESTTVEVTNGSKHTIPTKDATARIWERTEILDNYEPEDLKTSLGGLIEFSKFILFLSNHKKSLTVFCVGFFLFFNIFLAVLLAMLNVNAFEVIRKVIGFGS